MLGGNIGPATRLAPAPLVVPGCHSDCPGRALPVPALLGQLLVFTPTTVPGAGLRLAGLSALCPAPAPAPCSTHRTGVGVRRAGVNTHSSVVSTHCSSKGTHHTSVAPAAPV